MKDPETYLTSRGITLHDPVDAAQPARLDSLHRARVNYEFYFFASDKARARFAKDPVGTCGLLTDPVSRVRFRPTPTSPHAEYAGIPFYFESPATRQAFAAMPDSFLLPRLNMQALAPKASPVK